MTGGVFSAEPIDTASPAEAMRDFVGRWLGGRWTDEEAKGSAAIQDLIDRGECFVRAWCCDGFGASWRVDDEDEWRASKGDDWSKVDEAALHRFRAVALSVGIVYVRIIHCRGSDHTAVAREYFVRVAPTPRGARARRAP